MDLDVLPSTVLPVHAVTLIFNLLTPKANQHICEREYICDQNWVKFPSLVIEIWSSQVFGMHRLTDSVTDSQTQTQNAPGTVLTLAVAQKAELMSFCLTPSMPAVPNCCCSNGSAPYWSNHPF